MPALRDNPHADLVAVQHHDRETAERVARDFGVPHACTTAEEVLAIDGLQAAVISSVPALHYAQGMAALERGLHVLIEKPFTIRGDDGRELVRLADEKALHLMVGATYHFTRHCQEARRVLQSRVASAAVRMISILFTNLTEGLYRGAGVGSGHADRGRGALRASAALPCAGPDLVQRPGDRRWRPDLHAGVPIRPPTSAISPSAGRSRCSPVSRTTEPRGDVYDAIVLVLDDGTLVSLASNGAATAAKMHYELRVHGTGGVLEQELWKGTLSVDGEGGLTDYEPLAAEDTYPIGAPSENLIDLVRGAAENLSPGRHGAFGAVVSEAAVESARTGRPVSLP